MHQNTTTNASQQTSFQTNSIQTNAIKSPYFSDPFDFSSDEDSSEDEFLLDLYNSFHDETVSDEEFDEILDHPPQNFPSTPPSINYSSQQFRTHSPHCSLKKLCFECTNANNLSFLNKLSKNNMTRGNFNYTSYTNKSSLYCLTMADSNLFQENLKDLYDGIPDFELLNQSPADIFDTYDMNEDFDIGADDAILLPKEEDSVQPVQVAKPAIKIDVGLKSKKLLKKTIKKPSKKKAVNKKKSNRNKCTSKNKPQVLMLRSPVRAEISSNTNAIFPTDRIGNFEAQGDYEKVIECDIGQEPVQDYFESIEIIVDEGFTAEPISQSKQQNITRETTAEHSFLNSPTSPDSVFTNQSVFPQISIFNKRSRLSPPEIEDSKNLKDYLYTKRIASTTAQIEIQREAKEKVVPRTSSKRKSDCMDQNHLIPKISQYCHESVWEVTVRGNNIMRRCSDGWVNITHILKAEGIKEKFKRTRILENHVHTGTHCKKQGGFGKYQGTWVPVERVRGIISGMSIAGDLESLLALKI